MYVDDWVTGGDTEEEAFEKYEQGTKILLEGGFSLRKFKTNSDELHSRITGAEATEREVQLVG